MTKTPIPGKRREMIISFTDAGREYTKKSLTSLYRAEDKAMEETLERYSDQFNDTIEYFSERLKNAFEAENQENARQTE